MSAHQGSRAVFSIIEMFASFVVLGIIVFLAMPVLESLYFRAQMDSTLANERMLLRAANMMTMESDGSDPRLYWTSKKNDSGNDEVVSLDVFFTALVKGNYVTRAELRRLLSAHGKQPAGDQLTADNIALKLFETVEDSPPDQPFAITANWSDGTLTNARPYGKRGFVYVTKNGDGAVETNPAAASYSNRKIFPSARDGVYYKTLLK